MAADMLVVADASDETGLMPDLAVALGMLHFRSCKFWKAKACWQTDTPTSTSMTSRTMWRGKAENMWRGK